MLQVDKSPVLQPTTGDDNSLSILAAATPVLSTLLLCFFLRTIPGAELSVAAVLVSDGVLLSVREKLPRWPQSF